MPASEPFLKFLCVLKKRKGDGFRHYKNMIGNYDQEHEFLGAYGFKSWSDLQAETADVLEGFVACQMRPFSKMSMNEQGTARYHSSIIQRHFLSGNLLYVTSLGNFPAG